MSCKCNKSVEFGEKLASVYIESSDTAYKFHKSCVLVGHCSHALRLCPLHYTLCMFFLLMHTIALGNVVVDSTSKLQDQMQMQGTRRVRGMRS